MTYVARSVGIGVLGLTMSTPLAVEAAAESAALAAVGVAESWGLASASVGPMVAAWATVVSKMTEERSLARFQS